MVPNKKLNFYTRGYHSNKTKKYIEGKERNIYKSAPNFIKSDKECKDVPVSNFNQWVMMKQNGKYNDSLIAKMLRDSAFPNMEETFIMYVKAR